MSFANDIRSSSNPLGLKMFNAPPVQGCLIFSSSSHIFDSHRPFSHWAVTSPTKTSTAKREVEYSDGSNGCWVRAMRAAGEMLLLRSWIEQLAWCCKGPASEDTAHLQQTQQRGSQAESGEDCLRQGDSHLYSGAESSRRLEENGVRYGAQRSILHRSTQIIPRWLWVTGKLNRAIGA